MKTTELPKILDIFTKEANVPLMLWGPPGIGKTSAVETWAKARGMDITVLIGSLLDPTEIGGIPVVNSDSEGRQAMDYILPKWFLDMLQSNRDHVLFLDELNASSPAVMTAMLRLVQSRAIHDQKLPDSVRIVAAGNDPKQMELALPLPTAMCSRMAHLDVTAPSVADYAEAELEGWPVPEPYAANPTADRDRVKWSMIINRYLVSTGGCLEDYADSDGQVAAAGRGYPTPRSWSNLLTLLTHIAPGDQSAVHAAATSTLGSAGRTFAHFSSELDLPDPEMWLADLSSVQPLDTDDRNLAALAAVAAAAAEGNSARWVAGAQCVLKIAREGSPGLAVPAIRYLLQNKGRETAAVKAIYIEIEKVFGELLKKSGLV